MIFLALQFVQCANCLQWVARPQWQVPLSTQLDLAAVKVNTIGPVAAAKVYPRRLMSLPQWLCLSTDSMLQNNSLISSQALLLSRSVDE